jgi:hypothetical protein
MNNYIQGGVGDGDGSENDEGVARGAWGSAPLRPLPFMAYWEPPPMEMGSMGEAKMWHLAAAIRGWRSPPRVRFPPFI